MNDTDWMQVALEEAKKAVAADEVPIGAVLVRDSVVLSRAFNIREKSHNPLHHAEILVLEEAAKQIGDWRLEGCTLYVTLEPCPMCLGALLQARVPRLVYGCADPKREKSTFPSIARKNEISGNSHVVKITGGILEEECSTQLKNFFKSIR